jgi:hypothetical protein
MRVRARGVTEANPAGVPATEAGAGRWFMIVGSKCHQRLEPPVRMLVVGVSGGTRFGRVPEIRDEVQQRCGGRRRV